MLPFRKILFPVDYSEPCQAVVPYVKDMLGHFTADLTLVHAYGPGSPAYSELAAALPDWPEEVQALEDKRLREFAATAFPGEHVELFAKHGEAGHVIDEVVRHQGTDLVMLPTRGHGPVRRCSSPGSGRSRRPPAHPARGPRRRRNGCARSWR